MRMIIGSAIAATALVGCASPDTVALEHRSELAAQTRGVQLDENGRLSNVGMFGTTCQVSTEFAMVSDDFDYTGDQDLVVDAETIPGQGMTSVVITPDEINFTTPNLFPWSTTKVVPGAIDAKLVDGGFVGLQAGVAASDCTVSWFDNTDSEGTASSPAQPVTATSLGIECDDDSDLTADAETGTTWISTDTGVYRATPNGSVALIDETPNARLAWDADASALYLGALGDSNVRAYEIDGVLRWEVALDGEITALSHMGEESNAAVSIHTDLGGELIVIDGHTGEIEADLPTPSAASGIDVSADGRVMAVSLTNSVHYFDILATE